MAPPSTLLRRVRLRSLLRDEGGFTLVEMLIASTVFITIATGLAGILVSAIKSNSVSRDQSRGEQIAQAQMEQVRKLPFSDVGTVGGNPTGVVPANGNWSSYFGANTVPTGLAVPTGFGVTIRISNVNDAAGSWSSYTANYRRVVVTVTRSRDSKQLALLTTIVAPKNKSEMAGLASVGVNATIVDAVSNAGIADATVSLTSGPSPDRSDTTDSAGQVSFTGLTATNTSGSGTYYDLTAAKSGYQTLSADLPPATAARFTLAPSQSVNKTIRMYKGATISVALKDSAGQPYTQAAAVRVYSAQTSTWTDFAVAAGGNGTLAVTQLGSDLVYPNVSYTVRAYTSTGLCAQSSATNVPDSYPTTMTTTFNLTLGTCASQSVTVNVKQLSTNVTGASVALTGGPNNVSLSGTTDASGNVTFTNVPQGTETYTVTSTRTIGGQTYTKTDTTTVGSSAVTVNSVLPSPTTASVTVTVTGFGAALTSSTSATVSLTGSPFGTVFANQTTNASGVATFTGVPAGTGYQVAVTRATGATGSGSLTVTSGTNPITVALDTGTVDVTVTQTGVGSATVARGATLTLSGGPLSTTRTATADAAGTASFTGVVAGASYTVTAARYGQSATSASFTVASGSTSTVSLALASPTTRTLTVPVSWASQVVDAAAVTATDTVTGAVVTGATTSGGSAALAVPAGTWSLTASKNGSSANGSNATVSTSNVTATAIALPTMSLVVSPTWAGAAVSGATLTVAGGPNYVAGVTGTFTATPTGSSNTFTVPVGSSTYSYTVSATKSGYSGSVTSVASGPVSVPLPTQTMTVDVRWASQPVPGINVSATGGLNGGTYTSTVVTDASGRTTIDLPPPSASATYSVTGSLNGGSGTTSSVSSLTSPVTVSFTQTKSMTLTIRSNGANIPNTAVQVSITGGPAGSVGALPAYTYTGNTNGSSQVVITTPYASSGSFTVKVKLSSCSGSSANSSNTSTFSTSSSTTTATLNMTTAGCGATFP